MLQWLFRKKPAGARAPEKAAAPESSSDPIAYFNLGKIHFEMGRMNEASACYKKALALKPDYAEAHNNQGIVYQAIGQPDEAIASYRRALSKNPTLANPHYNLGRLLGAQGDSAGALACYYTALALNSEFTEAHIAEGEIHIEEHRWSDAAEALRKALAMDPDNAIVHNLLGAAFVHLDKLNEALACFRKVISIKPDFEIGYSNLGTLLAVLGRHDEAAAALRQSIAIHPGYVEGHQNLLFYLSYDPGISPEEGFAEHRAFGDRFEAPFRGRWPRHRNLPDPGRRLRVGFISADFRLHAVSSFIEPLWAALDPKQVEIWVYSNHPLEDEVTLRLKVLAQQWRKVVGMHDEDLADRILQDEIDILFDLSGHSGGNRLLAFARKPAPIQVSWIGNPNTTGLQAMDYYLADRFSAPPGLLDALFTEKIVRLPSGSLFQPLDPSPAVNGLPALESGGFTFGSFNRIDKLTEGVVALWSRVLNAVPGSRMLLGGLSDASSQRENLVAKFARHGVDSRHLVFHPRVGMTEYLALHHQVDLILDTFPIAGGTTTCHAVWMGVPVLTLVGKTMASRVGLIINSNLGLLEFITESEEAFVTQAVRWPQRLPELAALRASLRSRMLASPLCQAPAVARWLELALRTMWHRWCEGKPPESFGIDP